MYNPDIVCCQYYQMCVHVFSMSIFSVVQYRRVEQVTQFDWSFVNMEPAYNHKKPRDHSPALDCQDWWTATLPEGEGKEKSIKQP